MGTNCAPNLANLFLYVRRYPVMASLIPSTILYGVFLGQLHRGYRICTTADDFLSFSVNVGVRLIKNGCGIRRLCALFTTFVRRVVTKHPHRHKLCADFRISVSQ